MSNFLHVNLRFACYSEPSVFQRTVGYSCIVRLQASRHCAFVIWVCRSQKFMQSCNVFPPPPG